MSRIAQGAVTIVDINDGSNPISAVLTNQNHTFPANESGSVTTATRELFSTKAVVYIGNVLATLSTDSSLADNEYRIKPVGTGNTDTRILSGQGWSISVAASTGILTVTTIPSDVSTCTVAVVVEYKDPTQTTSNTIELTLTLSRVNEGAGGSVVNLSATSQTFFADFSGTFLSSGNDDIVIVVDTGGSPGSRSYQTSQNANPFSGVSTASTNIGGIKGFSDSLSGDFTTTGNLSGTASRLLISKDNLGTNDTLAIKVSGDNGGVDVVTVMKVREGDTGAAAVIVTINPDNGGTVFKNNSGTAKELTVAVTDAKDGSLLTPTNYQWFKNGNQVNVTSSSDRTVVSTGGEAASGPNYPTIIVGPEDVTNGAAEEFSCIVTVPD